MSLFRHLQTILEETGYLEQDCTGHTYAVLPSDSDSLHDPQVSWAVFLDVEVTGGAEGSQVVLTLETSHDGLNWVPAVELETASVEESAHVLKEVGLLGPYVRSRGALESAQGMKYKAKVCLACNAPFQVKRRTTVAVTSGVTVVDPT